MNIRLGRTKKPMSAAQKAALMKAIAASAAKRRKNRPDIPSAPRKAAAPEPSKPKRVPKFDPTKEPKLSATERASRKLEHARSIESGGKAAQAKRDERNFQIAKANRWHHYNNWAKDNKLDPSKQTTLDKYQKSSGLIRGAMYDYLQSSFVKNQKPSSTSGSSIPDPATMPVSHILRERKELIAKRNAGGLSKEEAARLVAIQAESAQRHQNRKAGKGTGPTKIALGSDKTTKPRDSRHPTASIAAGHSASSSRDNPVVPDSSNYAEIGSKLTDQRKSKWSAEDKDMINSYTMGDFVDVNRALQGATGILATSPERAARLRAAAEDFDKLFDSPNVKPTEDWMVVNRGTRGSFEIGIDKGLGDDLTLEDLQKQVGKTITNKGFISTSLGTDFSFPGTLNVRYKVPPGIRGLYVDGDGGKNRLGLAKYKGQREFILPRDLQYKVVSVKPSSGDKHKFDVEVEIVPPATGKSVANVRSESRTTELNPNRKQQQHSKSQGL